MSVPEHPVMPPGKLWEILPLRYLGGWFMAMNHSASLNKVKSLFISWKTIKKGGS